MKRKLCALAAALMLTLPGCGKAQQAQESEAIQTEPPKPAAVNLVTLGDSISYGYGLDDPKTERYSALLCDMLSETQSVTCTDNNYAVSGDDSSDLLKRLENGKAVRLPSADIILIEIGANNLLGVYSDYMAEQAKNPTDSETSMSDAMIDDIRTELESQLADGSAIQAELTERIDESLKRLDTDLQTLYQWIHVRNQTAEIYVLNVYNPFRGQASTLFLSETDQAEEFVQSQIDRCNSVLKNWTEQHDDLTYIDIAAAYAKCDTPPVIGEKSLSPSGSQLQYIDPHPNAEGQQLIADTVLAAMEAKQ